MKHYFLIFVSIFLASLSGITFASASKSSFTSEMSDNTGTYVIGDAVLVAFSATSPMSVTMAPVINLKVLDVNGSELEQKRLTLQAVVPGKWTGTLSLPHNKLGFYRVYASLKFANKVIPLAAQGSRPAGYLTYCVVANPVNRTIVPESLAFFGMQGGFSKATTKLLPLLGIRWVLANLDWANYSPSDPNEFVDGSNANSEKLVSRHKIEPLIANYREISWNLLPLPTLDVKPPAWLAKMPWDERFVAWRNYCRKAAILFAKEYPDLASRIYQVTWEPNFKFEFDGTPEQLVEWQKVAYLAVHSADPRAVVIGPTGSRVNAEALLWTSRLIDLGIAKYLDGWSLHPYTKRDENNAFREASLKSGIQSISNALKVATGHEIPIYSTEAGDQSLPNPGQEIRQARYLVESNVMMYGLGVRLSLAFYITDFKTPPHYGLYYNDVDGLPFGASILSPKPVAPAFAAMTYLLDGARPIGTAELGSTVTAYHFKRGASNIVVAWTTNNQYALVKIDTPSSQLKIYDWMGNLMASQNSNSVHIGSDPSYIVY